MGTRRALARRPNKKRSRRDAKDPAALRSCAASPRTTRPTHDSTPPKQSASVGSREYEDEVRRDPDGEQGREMAQQLHVFSMGFRPTAQGCESTALLAEDRSATIP